MAGTRLPRGAVGATEGELDERHFLGRIATFTHPEEYTGGSKVIRAWAKAGLDHDLAPKVRQDADVFRSACRAVETRRANGGSRSIEVKVDEVLNAPDECVYQITRMVRDQAEKLIEHPKAMRLTFTKATSSIDVDAFEDYDALRGLEEQIREHVAKNGKAIHSQKIRNAIRDTLLTIGAQNLRRKAGGLYFVPQTYTKGANGAAKPTQTKPVLDGLRDFLADIYGDRADFYTIPLVNDEGQREMVRKHFTINAGDKTRELLEDTLNRLRKGRGEKKVRQELLVRLHNERRKLGGAIDQFDSLVGLERKTIEADLRDLDKALSELQDLADEPKES